METLLLSVLLLQVSQQALGGVVEVHEGAESVLLPCEFNDPLPEDDPHFIWTREDLSPKSVHLQRAEKDDLTEQNQRFRGRTAMNPDTHITRNFSLTLMKPQQSDSGGYTCSISDGTAELKLEEVHLKLKGEQQAAEPLSQWEGREEEKGDALKTGPETGRKTGVHQTESWEAKMMEPKHLLWNQTRKQLHRPRTAVTPPAGSCSPPISFRLSL
ncbi:unnamed protein product [Menidia menidia]|uniref:(Atlantic silverside) hypothetical protein n=1 Tax=Menidia menidia TaxID=238744 RepID=A0A8S4AFL8_9TELE|nr:unnamed protein product [Menidia menidia]